MLQNYLHQIVLIGLYCLVNSNPYLIQHNSYYRQNNPAFYYPDNYYVSQSRQVQSYAVPKWSSNYQKVAVQQPQNYGLWSYQQNNPHRWPLSNYAGQFIDQNQQVQSESFNRPIIYRKQNQIKKASNAVSYNKKMDFFESKKKKNQPVCKRPGEVCYGWEPYIPENCCKGYVCDHETKSIVGVCRKKVVVKPLTTKQSNIVQRPLTTEELLGGGK